MTKKEKTGLDKLEEALEEAKDVLYVGIDETFDCADCEDDAEFPKKAVKETAKKLEKALAVCKRLLDD